MDMMNLNKLIIQLLKASYLHLPQVQHDFHYQQQKMRHFQATALQQALQIHSLGLPYWHEQHPELPESCKTISEFICEKYNLNTEEKESKKKCNMQENGKPKTNRNNTEAFSIINTGNCVAIALSQIFIFTCNLQAYFLCAHKRNSRKDQGTRGIIA